MNNLCNQILSQNTIKIAQKGKTLWLRLPTLYIFPIKYILVECIDSVVFPVKREGDILLTPRIPLPTLTISEGENLPADFTLETLYSYYGTVLNGEHTVSSVQETSCHQPLELFSKCQCDNY